MTTHTKQPNKSTYLNNSPARALSEERGINGLESLPLKNVPHKKTRNDTKTVNIEPPGQIFDPKYTWATTENILAKLDKSDLLPENKAVLGRFIMDARLGKTITKGAKKRVEGLRQAKYAQDLAKLDTFFRKPLEAITQADMERFILSLEDGRLKKRNGQPYAIETQVAIKKIVIKFYRWLNGGTTPALVSWIDTSFKLPDYHALTKAQIDEIGRILSGTTPENTTRNKAIVMVLFDSGARADELLNIRIRHLQVKDGEYWVRIEHSKTKPRTVSLPFCREYLDSWLDHHPARDQLEAQLFPLRHNALGNVIRRAGRVIGEKLTPHGIRHSSATYWAARLTPYQLAYRFGWSMSSKQPARYIDRAGVDQSRIVETVRNENTVVLKEQNQELHRRLAIMEEQFQRLLEGDIEEVRRIIEKVEKGVD